MATKRYGSILVSTVFSSRSSKTVTFGMTEPIKIKYPTINQYVTLFSQKGRNIRWQFEMFHGIKNLDKAIDLLPDKDREEFRLFTRTNSSFSRGNMFISKSSKVINDYFSYIFDWLNRCEKIFGFNLEGYGQIRMYTFLAERFLPFWFQKYTKFLEWPIVYHDINKI